MRKERNNMMMKAKPIIISVSSVVEVFNGGSKLVRLLAKNMGYGRPVYAFTARPKIHSPHSQIFRYG